ncbi:MAG: tripartite tricarboxylate transporter TctB family protein [Sulfolobales archaeon]
MRNAIKFTVMMIVYILLIPYVGFFLTSLIFMFTTQVIYGVSTLKALAISSAATFFIYILFIAILKVVVPEPILGALLYR